MKKVTPNGVLSHCTKYYREPAQLPPDWWTDLDHISGSVLTRSMAQLLPDYSIDIQTFEKVQEEIKRRSNVGIVDDRYMRKKSHYSTKRAEIERTRAE